MAISKIQLGNGDPQEIRDAKSLHYIGHAESGITPDQSGIYHSAASITIGTSVTVQKYDYVTLGTDNINLVCVDTTGSGETACTWAKLTEKAAEIPVVGVTIDNTSIVNETSKIAEIEIASNSTLGVVKIGTNISIGDGTGGTTKGAISVADASTSTKGVVELASTVDGTSASAATDVPTVAAVATAIADLPQAMIFRGSLGEGGTTTTLPEAAAGTAGDVYKVIVAGTYGGQEAQVGDLFICQQTAGTPITYSWVLIPSGDVPAGTVTSVGVATGANSNLTIATGVGDGDDPIIASGTITVGVASGYAIPNTESISHWNAAYTKVNPYTENTDIVNGLATAATQESGDGSVLIARVGGTANDTLFIDYIKPTIDTTKKAVAKANS